MDFKLSAFREPRGVMRVLHFVFSICAFATISGYSGYVQFKCNDSQKSVFKKPFAYPFQLNSEVPLLKNCSATLNFDFSSDAKFFVATGVLAMLYAIAIVAVYVKFEDLYKSNNKLPFTDFVITVIFGVLWISSSAAWANGLSGLKSVTLPQTVGCECSASTSSFSTLNISVIFGFLNFFLWAADLWFLYKETAWFQGNQPKDSNGV